MDISSKAPSLSVAKPPITFFDQLHLLADCQMNFLYNSFFNSAAVCSQYVSLLG
jgi:hypothetical protein